MCVITVLQMAMNVDNEAEADCILAQVDIFVPDSSPELLEAVRTSTVDAVCAEGMAPREGSHGRVWIRGDFCLFARRRK